MNASYGRTQLEWARVLFESLADAGVTDVVVSPGSRSTPLVLALAETPRLRVHEVIDERSAAFFALGQARATGRPSVCVCTSGTAGAHYLPAVVEAGLSGLPLILLTADRPLELQDAGALQTIDQVKLFGDHARAFFELGVAEEHRTALVALRRKAAQIVLATAWPRPGAVHVNARARKPLEPTSDEISRPLSDVVTEVLARPLPRATRPKLVPEVDVAHEVAALLARAERGVLLAGPGAITSDGAARLAAELARRAGLVVLAEATSGLRFPRVGVLEGVSVVSAFDPLLRTPSFRAAARPDLVVQLGPTLTSSGVDLWLAAHADVPRVIVGPLGWQDPQGTASHVVVADVEPALAAILEHLGPSHRDTGAWREVWRAADRTARAAIADLSEGEMSVREVSGGEMSKRTVLEGTVRQPTLTEGEVTRAVVSALGSGDRLLVGNGLPIRHLDTFTDAGAAELRVHAQRGASGIDGLVSGAAGLASVADGPVVLFTGDVSALHDLGGLAAAAEVKTPLVLVVVNNDGGRIFEQLPIARTAGLAPGTLERFTTPHGRSFEGAAAMFGLPHREVRTRDALARALEAARAHAGATFIEAVVPPHEAEETRAALARALTERLDPTRWLGPIASKLDRRDP